jgi:hypothetical protein
MPKYKQQKFTVKIPEEYTKIERQAIGQDIIDYIIERTQKGFDKNGHPFKGYSKSYRESLDFKIAGKGKTVDLTLTEEMLNELKIIKTKKGEIEIGYDGRKNSLNGKVEGNRLGTYGNKKSVTKGRDFLGIKKTPLDKILREFPLDEDRFERALRAAAATEAAESVARNIQTNFNEDDE